MDAGHRVRVEAVARGPAGPSGVPGARFHRLPGGRRDRREGARPGVAGRAAIRCGCLRDLTGRRRWARDGEEVWPLLALASPRAANRPAPASVTPTRTSPAIAALNAMRLAACSGVTYSVDRARLRHLPAPAQSRARSSPSGLRGHRLRIQPRPSAGARGPAGRRAHPRARARRRRRARSRARPRCPAAGACSRSAASSRRRASTDLVDAAARADVERVTIVGDGPLREPLERAGASSASTGWSSCPAAGEPAEVRAALEDADVLAMPCVVARGRRSRHDARRGQGGPGHGAPGRRQ